MTTLHSRITSILLLLLFSPKDSNSFVPLHKSAGRLLSLLPLSAMEHGDNYIDNPTATTTTRTARLSTSLPRRPSRKIKKKRSERTEMMPQPISNQDLANYVHDLYLYGPCGRLHHTTKKNGKPENDDEDRLQRLNRHPTLVLNADYQPLSDLPLSVWTWQEAVKAVFSGKGTVLEVYDNVRIRAATLEVPLPSVIVLNEYIPKFEQIPAFTKRNVFLRDEYRCQYCQRSFHTRDLSLDHVIPRCKGGRLGWTNAVTSCKTCNGRKGSKSLTEFKSMGMQLQREPRIPTHHELTRIAASMMPRKVHPTWEPFLPHMMMKSMNNIIQNSTIPL